MILRRLRKLPHLNEGKHLVFAIIRPPRVKPSELLRSPRMN